MAEAVANNNEENWSVDAAFRYLTKVVGLRDYVALHQMKEKICQQHLSVRVDGRAPPPTLWVRGDLVLDIVNGKAQVVANAAMRKPMAEYIFTVAATEVQLLWPPANAIDPDRSGGAGRPSASHHVIAEFERRVEAGEVIPRGRLKTEAEHLARWWAEKRQNKPALPPLTVGTIENAVRKRWNALANKTVEATK